MQHEPGRGLGHFDITSQLRTSDALQASQFQVDGDCPLPQREGWFLAMGVPVRMLKYFRQSEHQYGIGFLLVVSMVLVDPQRPQHLS